MIQGCGELAAKHGALSCDHCEYTSAAGAKAMGAAGVVDIVDIVAAVVRGFWPLNNNYSIPYTGY